MKKHKCKRKGKMCGHRRKIGSSFGDPTICCYLLDTGKRRGCPAGDKCEHWTEEKCEILPEFKSF